MSAQKRRDASGIRYPLKISANRRYLVDQDERPVLLHGDSPWSLIVGPPPEKAEMYLADRAAKGFNSIVVNLIEHYFTSDAPNNYRGDGPFTTPNDMSTPNEEYFQHADWVIEKAGEYGLQVVLAVTFVGYHGGQHGWQHEMIASGPRKCREYGRYVAKRYGGHDHVLWYMACDQNPTVEMETVLAMAEGVREVDGDRHLMTALPEAESSTRDIFPDAKWLTLNATYSYKLVHERVRLDYNREPVTPIVLIETTYEGEKNASNTQIRRQAYWAMLCGGCGHCVGIYPLWQFADGWEKTLDGWASRDMVHFKRLFDSRPWWQLVQTRNRSVVTRGMGECHGLDYLAAAMTTDGSCLIAYMPTARAVKVDMSKLSGKEAAVWWFNPRTGEAHSGGTLPTKGEHVLTPPTPGRGESELRNDLGNTYRGNDWVLVLDDAAKGRVAPGMT